MRIITILNKIHYLKSFVFLSDQMEIIKGNEAFVVKIVPRSNSKPVCKGCDETCSVFDHQRKHRLFEFVPLWGVKVYFRYRARRTDCPRCGILVESMPWATGKRPLTRTFQIYLAKWAKKLSWKETAEAFNTSWESVYRSIKMVVSYGLEHRNLDEITAIGIDEWQYSNGHKYLTLVYQINDESKRLLFTSKDRTKESLHAFFDMIGKQRSDIIKYVCTDMWRPYLWVIKERIPQALNILDRFHIVQKLNKAVDKVRIEEAKSLKEQGFPDALKNTKYCYLKNRENLTNNQALRLADVLQYDYKSVRVSSTI